MPRSGIYHGWDVHSYTPDLRAALAEWRTERPRLSELLDQPVKRDVIDGPISEFFLSRNAELKAVLDKMRDRSEKRTSGNLLFYGDRDLNNLNIWALLAIAVNLALAEKGPSELLVEMLVDTAQTCIQGDSHRIAMFVLGCA